MTSSWQVLVPLGSINVTNLITNPSGETANPPTGFTVGAGTLARVATQQRRGVYGIQYTPAAGVNDGYYWLTAALTNAHIYVFSLDLYGTNAIPYQILFTTTVPANLGTPTPITGTGYWNPSRVAVAFTTVSGAALRVRIEKNNSADVTPFWTDGWCLIDCTAAGITQAQGLALTYFDGDQPGAYWTGTSHASTSVLSGESKDGGVLNNFDTDLNTTVESESGIGAPPLSNVVLAYGLADGGLFQRTRQMSRNFLLNVNWKIPAAAPSLNNLHLARKGLLNAIKADSVTPQQTAWYRYLGTSKPQWIRAAYDAGAEMNLTPDTANKEKATLRFVAPDPLFYEEGNAGTTAAINQSITANSILERSPSGVWSQMGTGVSGGAGVIALAVGQDGTVYAGGQYTAMNAVGNTNGLAQWNGAAWSAMGTGPNGIVYALVIGPDGSLYAGGTFTLMGGVANTIKIAKWNGSVWSALGTGMTGANNVYSLGIGNDGSLYAGGDFTQMGGVANTAGIAKWNGSVWSAMGTGATGGIVYSIVTMPDGSIIACGAFTSMGGVANTQGIAKWNGSAWVSIGTVAWAGGAVYSAAVGPDGALYVGGNFTSVGGVSCTNIAKWNGTTWSALGTGVSGGAQPVFENGLSWAGGLLYIGGTFTTAGGLTPPSGLVIWNGSTYIYSDIVLPGSGAQTPVIFDKQGNFIIGFGNNGTATVTINPTFTNNGSAIAHPTFTFTGPGTLQQIKNYTTGDIISFNLTLLAGETATLNLNPGQISFKSSFRGNILGTILPASNLFTFKLMPGANNLSVLISGATTAATTWTATWKIANLSADGGSS